MLVIVNHCFMSIDKVRQMKIIDLQIMLSPVRVWIAGPPPRTVGIRTSWPFFLSCSWRPVTCYEMYWMFSSPRMTHDWTYSRISTPAILNSVEQLTALRPRFSFRKSPCTKLGTKSGGEWSQPSQERKRGQWSKMSAAKHQEIRKSPTAVF